jgi:hypothetical protein
MIAELIRPSLLEFIKKKVPDLDNKAFICFEDLGEFRKDYVKEVLEDEIGELTALDQEVVESLERHEILPPTSAASSKGNSHLASASPTTSRSSAAVGNFSLHLALLSLCGSVRTPFCSLPERSIRIHSFCSI